jgi:hypothetical protein
MTETQVLQTIQDFLKTKPAGLANSVKFMIGRVVEDLDVEVPKQKVMNMLATALSSEELDDIYEDIQAKSEKKRQVRDAQTTQAHERPIFQMYMDDYAEWADTIKGAKAEKTKRSVAEISVAKNMPMGMFSKEVSKFLGGRTRSRRSCRKQTKRRRCRSMTSSKRR